MIDNYIRCHVREVTMHLMAGIVAIAGGVLCMPGIYTRIIKNVIEINRTITNILLISGFFICICGIFLIIHSYIISVTWLSMGWIVYWLIYNVAGICAAMTGFLTGFGMIQIHIIDRVPDDLKLKAQAHIRILGTIQIILGLISIILGVVSIIFNSSTHKF
ncbi:MAG: hypothetical protein JXJ04_08135 [Spirochaetales bacterium]|nr:hypothetical protein [Spirochaetales bacterium]